MDFSDLTDEEKERLEQYIKKTQQNSKKHKEIASQIQERKEVNRKKNPSRRNTPKDFFWDNTVIDDTPPTTPNHFKTYKINKGRL